MAEPLNEIEDCAIGTNNFGAMVYVINGKPGTREDFIAIAAFRIANHLAGIEDLLARLAGAPAPSGGEAPPGAPGEGPVDLFGNPQR